MKAILYKTPLNIGESRTRTTSTLSLMILIACFSWLPWVSLHAADETVDLRTITVVGIEPANVDIPQVREHLLSIGGFKQARSTIRQGNIDKFFTWSRIRDSYYLEFRYNHKGSVTSVKRLYRPYSTENSNRRTPISTKEVALKLIEQAGQPNRMLRKGWGGTLTYSSYEWEDDSIKIVVDREGGERLGNVFVEYIVKNESPYAIAKLD